MDTVKRPISAIDKGRCEIRLQPWNPLHALMHSCASRMREYGGNENTHRNHCGYIRFVYTRVSSSSPFSLSLSISLSCVSQRIGTRACSLRPGTRTSNRRINNPSFTCCLCPKPSCSFQWSWKLYGREDGIHQGWRVKGSFLYVCFNGEGQNFEESWKYPSRVDDDDDFWGGNWRFIIDLIDCWRLEIWRLWKVVDRRDRNMLYIIEILSFRSKNSDFERNCYFVANVWKYGVKILFFINT